MERKLHPKNTSPYRYWTDKQKILNRVDTKMMSGCWFWSGCVRPDGYGSYVVKHSRSTLAHRKSYEAFIGPIPKGMHVLHKCDQRSCVRPDHLFLGTNKDNILDRVKKGRSFNWANVKTCRAGHERNENNSYRKPFVDMSGVKRIRTVCRVCAKEKYERRKKKSFNKDA